MNKFVLIMLYNQKLKQSEKYLYMIHVVLLFILFTFFRNNFPHATVYSVLPLKKSCLLQIELEDAK